ncbi:BMP-binding endothelial regulator protein [Hypsibius exemplaris]|uniref:BMP-binding endothelial regulator protein n=1 Tax=Hypsibius exemplaris TaxID=2072580 RepID=A0A1W0X4D7_HYPEX|nr:BMP-binding endothelial regulator protein [Hypsibius exemplaris]
MWNSKALPRTAGIIRHLVCGTVLCLLLSGDCGKWSDTTATAGGASAQGLQGETAYCSEEGSLVEVPGITSSCLKCRCENYKIACEQKKKCPDANPERCYFHLYDQSDEEKCCTYCKGCDFENVRYHSGQRWVSPTDPCVSYQCADGIVTKSAKTVCYTPCTNPVHVNGTCCPVCKGCYANGRSYGEMETVPAPDPCVQCICSGGKLICDKTACPVLACPVNLYMYEAGSCCPKCHGKRDIAVIENRCIVGKRILRPGQQPLIDNCTSCTCLKSTLLCKRQVCPILACPAEFQERTAHSCCPTCREGAPIYCETEEATYNNGDSWYIEPCVKSTCDNGMIKFGVEECPASLQCGPNEVAYKDKKDCCPKCVPDAAVCTVYGDPHYKTFDGQSFSFQGKCKYTAVEDCHKKNKRFDVQLRNDARKSAHFTWTKSVAIRTEKFRIVLLQNLHVRVDRKTVKLPHVKLGAFSILSNGYSLVVRTTYGLKVTWDGDSYVEISLPHEFRNKVCGLCGNYNGNATDDFLIKGTSTVTEEVADFAQSWLVSRKSDAAKCLMPDTEMPGSEARPRLGRNIPCPSHPLKKGLAVLRSCQVFKNSATRACRKLVNPDPYYRSCLVDMCDCPRKRPCLCSSLLAFLRECERQGGSGENIRESHCRALS